MEFSGIEGTIAYAEKRWPNTVWKIKTPDEACSPCPWCGGEDRFVLWTHGYYACRAAAGHCGRQGWLDEGEKHKWTKEEIRLRRIEAEQNNLKRKQEELARRLRALEQMSKCHDHETYHNALKGNEEAFEWFLSQGLQPKAIFDYQLGVCDRCPTDREGRPSYTFPVWRKDERLWTIRHRIQHATNGDKYRPHMAGLGKQLVNARYLPEWKQWVGIVEGCKKARVIQQYDLPVVGVMGKSGFEMRWLSWFAPSAAIYICLDPDAQEDAERLGKEIAQAGKRVYVAHFPMKPDDMFVAGGSRGDWLSYVRLARRVQ